MENVETTVTLTVKECPHTRRTIQVETGANEKTVRRWVKKAGVTGHKIKNVERFTDAQRDLILACQSEAQAKASKGQSKAVETTEEIEVELVEPGAITLATPTVIEAQPLFNFDLKPVEVDTLSLDTSALDAQNAQFEQVTHQGANVIVKALSARFDAGLQQIVAEQDSLLKGVKAHVINNAAASVSKVVEQPGKPKKND